MNLFYSCGLGGKSKNARNDTGFDVESIFLDPAEKLTSVARDKRELKGKPGRTKNGRPYKFIYWPADGSCTWFTTSLFLLEFFTQACRQLCHAPTCRDACSLYSRLCHLLEKEKPLILFTATLCTGGDGKSFEFVRRLLEKEKPGSLMDRSASLIACSRSEWALSFSVKAVSRCSASQSLKLQYCSQ